MQALLCCLQHLLCCLCSSSAHFDSVVICTFLRPDSCVLWLNIWTRMGRRGCWEPVRGRDFVGMTGVFKLPNRPGCWLCVSLFVC